MKRIIIYLFIAFGTIFLVSCTPDRYGIEFVVKNNTGETIYLAPMTSDPWTGQSETIHHGSSARIKAVYDLNESGAHYFDLLFLEEPKITIIKIRCASRTGNPLMWYLANADDEGRQFFNAKFWASRDESLHNSGYVRVWTFTIEPEDLEL